MTESVTKLLKCPVCGASMYLSEDGKVCRCTGARTHCFDVARIGHVHLGGPHAGDGDGKEAVASRRAFLDAGYYRPLSDAINEILDRIGARTVLDAGCGEGYYTNRMATARDVLGIDLSRAGVEMAAKRAKALQTRASFAVASIFSLPVLDGALDAVVNIFAPCAEEEFSRVLRSGGHLLLVGAGEHHLMGLKRAVYENAYENEGRADLPQNMRLVERLNCRYEITVEGNDAIEALFSMTPYYWRTSRTDRAKLVGLERLTTELDFDLFLFEKG